MEQYTQRLEIIENKVKNLEEIIKLMDQPKVDQSLPMGSLTCRSNPFVVIPEDPKNPGVPVYCHVPWEIYTKLLGG